MRKLILLAAAAGLASCTQSPMELQHAGKNPFTGGKSLSNTLAGRGAGLPLNCLPTSGRWRSQSLGDGGLAYRSGGQTYVATFEGGCANLNRIGVVMVTQAGRGGMCQGDTVELIDRSTGMSRGSCRFGPFVPRGFGSKFG
jgi:hypothetical protein